MKDIFIPEQVSGSKSDISDTITCENLPDAKQHFVECVKRLKTVNGWHTIAGKGSAEFQLTDESGTPLNRAVESGDLFKIQIPLTTNDTGDGFDWVQVEDLQEHFNPAAQESEFIYFRVRPCDNPGAASDDTAHFFDHQATSTFLLRRDNNSITAAVHGRNEHINNEGEGFLDKARNAFVALGAKIGLSSPQWLGLVKGILDK